MSYSFNVKADSKAGLIAEGEAQLYQVREQQPVHAHDIDAHRSAMVSLIDLIGEPGEGQALSLNMSGSLYTIDGTPKGASLSIHINPMRI